MVGFMAERDVRRLRSLRLCGEIFKVGPFQLDLPSSSGVYKRVSEYEGARVALELRLVRFFPTARAFPVPSDSRFRLASG